MGAEASWFIGGFEHKSHCFSLGTPLPPPVSLLDTLLTPRPWPPDSLLSARKCKTWDIRSSAHLSTFSQNCQKQAARNGLSDRKPTVKRVKQRGD